MLPRVSVCCSVLNQGEMLEEMIASVFSQTFEDWELIIVDDGSTEDIKDVIDRFKDDRGRVRYHRFEKNLGIPNGINLAFHQAKGEYVQPLAADETITPEKLAQQVEYLDEHKEIAAVFGLPQNGLLGKRPEWEQYALKAQNRNKTQWLATLLNLDHVPIGGCSSLFRRSLFDEIGYFDTNLVPFSDHEWYCRLIEKHEIRILPYRWALSRQDGNSVSVADTPEKKERAMRELAYVREKHPLNVEDPNVSKVTVGIPVKDMKKFVGHAIASILSQSHQDFEILVCDDGSTDGTASAVQSIIDDTGDERIRLIINESNIGSAATTTRLMNEASGELFVPLSADDTLDPEYLKKCVELFRNNAHLEFVASQTDFIDAEGKQHEGEHAFKQIEKAANKSREQWLERLRFGNVYFGAGMYRTKAIRDIGGWREDSWVLSDYEMYLALLQRGEIYIIEEPLTHTRIHESNRSTNIDARRLRDTYAKIRSRFYVPRPKVVIASAFYESRGFSPYIDAMAMTVKMLTAHGIEHQFIQISGDSYAHRAKNTLLNKFLEDPEATHVLMVDSDMYWNADAILTMLSQEEEIIVGSYPQKNKWDMWTSLPKFERDENGHIFCMEKQFQNGGALMKGEHLAGGFMVMKRSALEKFRDHFKDLWYKDPSADPTDPDRTYTAFFWPEIRENKFVGEDRIFSRRLAEMGMDWWIYTDIQFSHWGINGWSGNFKDFITKMKADARKQAEEIA